MFSGSSNTAELVQLLSDVRVSGKSNMAAIYRMYLRIALYLSLCTRKEQDYNGYPAFFGVQQHHDTRLETLRHPGDW